MECFGSLVKHFYSFKYLLIKHFLESKEFMRIQRGKHINLHKLKGQL